MATAKGLRRAYDDALGEQLAITFNEAIVLAQLAGRRPVTQVELARQVGLTRARIGVHIDSLVAKGAVRREADALDRRVWRVSLTRSGRSLWKRSVDVSRSVGARVHQGLTGDDLDALDRVLRAVQANVATSSGDVG